MYQCASIFSKSGQTVVQTIERRGRLYASSLRAERLKSISSTAGAFLVTGAEQALALRASLEAAAVDHSSLAIGGSIQPLTPSLLRRGVPRDRGRAGNRGCLGSPERHEESEARMLKVNWLTLSAPPTGLSKLLYPWPDPPIPLQLTPLCTAGAFLVTGAEQAFRPKCTTCSLY